MRISRLRGILIVSPLHVLATPLAFCHSAAPSGCTTASPATPLCLPAAPLSQPTVRCRMTSHDVAWYRAPNPLPSLTRYRLRPTTASDLPSSSTRFPLVPRWCSTWRCTLHFLLPTAHKQSWSQAVVSVDCLFLVTAVVPYTSQNFHFLLNAHEQAWSQTVVLYISTFCWLPTFSPAYIQSWS